jgi:endonuclease/exonuclease/phosphatase family metal-dependent hydrolase
VPTNAPTKNATSGRVGRVYAVREDRTPCNLEDGSGRSYKPSVLLRAGQPAAAVHERAACGSVARALLRPASQGATNDRSKPALDESRVELTIGSYNVHRCVGADRKCAPERIARVIAELDVDVLALQEVDWGYHHAGTDQIALLAEMTGMHAIAGPTMTREGGHYGNVLLTRDETTAVRHVDLSVAGKEPRGAIDADLLVRERRVRIVVTHLGLRRFERAMQVDQILRSVNSAAPGSLTIVAGDLNEWRRNDHSLQALHVRFGRSRLRTFPARRPLFAFDRILVEPREALLSFTVHDSALARVASDHLPVRAVVAV